MFTQMDLGVADQRRATAIVRTLVVASATLAILLVCFSIYQYSQLDPGAAAKLGQSRPSPAPTEPLAASQPGQGVDPPGVVVGQATIGAGQKIQMTLYPREGDRAQFEIAADDWTPVAGSSNEFVLRGPEVRMCTNDGHPVRIAAAKGVLETERKAGGGLAVRRGKLTGGVEIDYDRLTMAERAQLPEELRSQPDPKEIVHIELEELDFDLEWSKLIVPGPLRLSAADVELQAADVEIRFNEAEDRVEQMRIRRGGRLELRGQGEQLGLSIPAVDETGERRLTLVEWLRASIQSKLDAQAQMAAAQEAPPTAPAVTTTEDGVPVVRADAKERERPPRPPIRYYARFEGDVSAVQRVGDTASARLDADALEIVRDVTDKERGRVRSAPQPSITEGDTSAAPADDTVTLEWTERMVVEACSADDQRCSGSFRSRITAHGSPARISNPEGDAACTRLTFDPDGDEVWLDGDEDKPVAVRYADQGTVSGVAVYSRRQGDDTYLRVTGPGRLARESAEVALPREPSGVEREDQSTIDFTDQMEVHGRLVTRTTVDFTGLITKRRQRVLDRASFAGRVSMRQGDAILEADKVDLAFGTGRHLHRDRQTIDRITGRGHVVMKQGEDRLLCQELDMSLAVDADGRTVPRTVTAVGDVAAEQGQREIKARDKLVVDFELTHRPPAPFDAAKAYAEAVKAGADPTQIDWEARQREHEQASRTETGVKRLRAWTDVTVNDPRQGLEVSAGELDCTVADGREIETALVKGTEQSPASVRLEAFTVSGAEIKVNVPDQWADVPGSGRLTFRSRKDLDGRRAAEPIPIAITWSDWMKYQGRENRSVFMGNVHATSQTTTTFDCDQLIVEFADVPKDAAGSGTKQDWWNFEKLVDGLSGESKPVEPLLGAGRFAKEPTYILATGKAVAVTSEPDPETGDLKSRARISGPKLSVDLRPEVSKMLIEGPGNLLIEDNRRGAPGSQQVDRGPQGLFGMDESPVPSNTLIQWEEYMWYDFSIDQTRFEGNVDLKYFSGAELARIRGQSPGGGADAQSGRSTFLSCDVLTVDFHDRSARSPRGGDTRMGRLSADQLRQFQASGAVRLQDQAEGLSLTADRVVYERNRKILVIYGTAQRKAHIVKQEPGRLPNQVSVERLFYNLATGRLELTGPTVDTR
jgi:lipopolysaccharide export system protein LptA